MLNSSYFEGKLKYFPEDKEFKGECEKKEISFQAEQIDFVDELLAYKEWMLLCPSQQVEKNVTAFQYFVSRAYSSEQVFVYTRDPSTEEIFLESVGKNISIVVDDISIPFVDVTTEQ